MPEDDMIIVKACQMKGLRRISSLCSNRDLVAPARRSTPKCVMPVDDFRFSKSPRSDTFSTLAQLSALEEIWLRMILRVEMPFHTAVYSTCARNIDELRDKSIQMVYTSSVSREVGDGAKHNMGKRNCQSTSDQMLNSDQLVDKTLTTVLFALFHHHYLAAYSSGATPTLGNHVHLLSSGTTCRVSRIRH
eukprot:IDg1918t1